jgi:hypothetical protein
MKLNIEKNKVKNVASDDGCSKKEVALMVDCPELKENRSAK